MNAVNEQEPVSPHNAVLLLVVDRPYVVVDACGHFEPQPPVATVSRLTQAGVALVNTRVIVLDANAFVWFSSFPQPAGASTSPRPASALAGMGRAGAARAGKAPAAGARAPKAGADQRTRAALRARRRARPASNRASRSPTHGSLGCSPSGAPAGPTARRPDRKIPPPRSTFG